MARPVAPVMIDSVSLLAWLEKELRYWQRYEREARGLNKDMVRGKCGALDMAIRRVKRQQRKALKKPEDR